MIWDCRRQRRSGRCSSRPRERLLPDRLTVLYLDDMSGDESPDRFAVHGVQHGQEPVVGRTFTLCGRRSATSRTVHHVQYRGSPSDCTIPHLELPSSLPTPSCCPTVLSWMKV